MEIVMGVRDREIMRERGRERQTDRETDRQNYMKCVGDTSLCNEL